MSTAGLTAETRSSIARPQDFQTRPADHRFFSIVSVVTSVTIVAGFWNTYLPKILSGTPLPPIIHVHAAIFTSWLAFYVTQTTLVLNGKTTVHRRLGIAGAVLAVLMLVVGTATSITVTRLGHRGIPGVEFPDPAGFLLLNLNALFVFAILVAAGWYFRRNAQAHKRLMLMATMSGLVGPGVSRLPFISGKPPIIALFVLGFLLTGPIYDLVTRRRVHAAYLWSVPLAFLAVPPIVAQLSASTAWQRVAAMLLR
jgi:hypothetical protein